MPFVGHTVKLRFRDETRPPVWIRTEFDFDDAYKIWEILTTSGVVDRVSVASCDLVRDHRDADEEILRRFGFKDPRRDPHPIDLDEFPY